MISIFADSVIQDNRTVSFTDSEDFISADVSFTETSVLNKFLYLETINLIVQNASLDVKNIRANLSCDVIIDLELQFLSNGIVLDTFSKRLDSISNLGAGQSATISYDTNGPITADIYADSSLDINVRYNFKSNRSSGIVFDGNQSGLFDTEVQFIGRSV